MKAIYIAGKMTGLPKFNFPAFYAAEEQLRAAGWIVYNPARIDNEKGFDENLDHKFTLEEVKAFAVQDIDILLHKVKAIYLLRGWRDSKGARAEHAIAEWLGHQIIEQP